MPDSDTAGTADASFADQLKYAYNCGAACAGAADRGTRFEEEAALITDRDLRFAYSAGYVHGDDLRTS